MKCLILCSLVFYVCLVLVSADDDPVDTDNGSSTEDQGSSEETVQEAPAEESTDAETADVIADSIEEDDKKKKESTDEGTTDDDDDQSTLNDPSVAEEDLPAEVFNAAKVSVKRKFGDRNPYPAIIQGGRPTPQNPSPFKALKVLKDGKTADGKYPTRTKIPAPKHFSCKKVHQAGFYADEDFGCQVFRRCDLNGGLTSYLCPAQTIFNQITLVCDWYYNVQCYKSSDFYDYSNSRLYHENWPLLDDSHPTHHHQGHHGQHGYRNTAFEDGNHGGNVYALHGGQAHDGQAQVHHGTHYDKPKPQPYRKPHHPRKPRY